jgi:hypothetical protein
MLEMRILCNRHQKLKNLKKIQSLSICCSEDSMRMFLGALDSKKWICNRHLWVIDHLMEDLMKVVSHNLIDLLSLPFRTIVAALLKTLEREVDKDYHLPITPAL